VTRGPRPRVPRLGVPALGLALVLAGAAPGAGQRSPVVLTGTVSRVVDGDTVRVVTRGFETPVRLVGIDTPETRAPGEPVECFGPEATARARRLLPVGARVRLATDPTQDTRDRYGRLLAYVYRGADPVSVNLRLVRSGHARVYVYRPSRPFVPALRAPGRVPPPRTTSGRSHPTRRRGTGRAGRPVPW
jgi:micrococcal nuclease